MLVGDDELLQRGVVGHPDVAEADAANRRVEVVESEALHTVDDLGADAAEREAAILKRTLEAQLRSYKENPKAADALLRVGESPRDDTLPSAELAAYTIVASVILNLDEVVTKY